MSDLPAENNNTENDELPASGQMDLIEHLRELRKRLLYTAVFICGGAAVCFVFSTEVFHLLTEPFFNAFSDKYLIGTGPAEAFILRVKAAFFAGAIVACPCIFYQIWAFISPGLYNNEKKLLIPFLVSTSLLFFCGTAFCYYIVLPFAFDFFLSQYNAIGVEPTIRISEHISLVIKALLGFGIVFEMPVLAFFLGRLGLITHHTLLRGTRLAIVVIFILAAVLTPPDLLTQFLMAGPLILLYGLSILIVKYTARRKQSEDSETQHE